MGIGCGNMVLNCFDEFIDTAEYSSSETVDCQIAKEAFHHVQPRGACGCEVEMKLGIAPLPGRNLVMLMGRIVVADDVNLFFLRRAFPDQVQEANPFLMPVLVHAGADDPSIRSVHGGEERGGAVWFVVMGHGPAAALIDWKARLSAIQRLDLALLVAREHDRVFRRIEAQADKIVQLLLEPLVVGKLEGSDTMLLESGCRPHPAGTGRTHSDFLRHGRPAPMRGPDRLLIHG